MLTFNVLTFSLLTLCVLTFSMLTFYTFDTLSFDFLRVDFYLADCLPCRLFVHSTFGLFVFKAASMVVPAEMEDAYINRNHQTSINVVAVAGHKQQSTFVRMHAPGRMHDSSHAFIGTAATVTNYTTVVDILRCRVKPSPWATA